MKEKPIMIDILERMSDKEYTYFDNTDKKTKKDFMEIILERQNQVYKDALTDAHNRRAFDEELAKKKDNTDFSIVSIDLDKFKSVNDTYGHKMGDEVLKGACELINSVLKRKGDILLYRVGGEELQILLPKTNEDGAEIVAENIRKTLEDNLYIVGKDSSDSILVKNKSDLKNYESPNLRNVTASIGVVHYDPKTGNLDDLLSDVDKALYEAKETGRNKVVTYRKSA